MTKRIIAVSIHLDKMEKQRNEIKVFLVILTVVFLLSSSSAQQEQPEAEIPPIIKGEVTGKFEVSVHYSLWTMDPIKNIFEEDLAGRVAEEIGIKIRDFIRDDFGIIGIEKADYLQELVLDSGGWNYGVEIRFYPKGKEGAFSLAFSFEKTKMRLKTKGSVVQEFKDGTYAEAEAQSEIFLSPFSTHINFRWDIKPRWRVTPYFVFGIGVGKVNGKLNYEYSGHYFWEGLWDKIEEKDEMTLEKLEEDVDFNIPTILPIIQLNLGLRANIIYGIQLRTEVGIWDGFLFRMGLGYRF